MEHEQCSIGGHMPLYYFDIETTGIDPNHDKIITIQYQKLDFQSGEPAGEITILKEWEEQASEKNLIEKLNEIRT